MTESQTKKRKLNNNNNKQQQQHNAIKTKREATIEQFLISSQVYFYFKCYAPTICWLKKAVRSVAPLLCRTQELDPTHLEGSGSAFETIQFQVDWIKFSGQAFPYRSTLRPHNNDAIRVGRMIQKQKVSLAY